MNIGNTYFLFTENRDSEIPLPLQGEELILRQLQVVESTWPLLSHDSSSTVPSLSTFENG